jgi:hypothetical protein
MEIQEDSYRSRDRSSQRVDERRYRRAEIGKELQENQDQAESSRVRARRVHLPQWCPSGVFSRSQKRRVQRLRHREVERNHHILIEEEHRPRKIRKVWRPKPINKDPKPSADVNAVVLLPAEFGASEADEYYEDFEGEEERPSAKLSLSPQKAVFEKP